MKRISDDQWSASTRFKQENIFPVSANKKKPKISLEYLGGSFCISKCQAVEKADVVDTLHRISALTWQEIIQCGKAGSGYEQFSRDSIKYSIPKVDLFNSIDKVTVFHRKGKIPVIGFRIEETFYIVAVDRTFSAYKH